MRKNDDIHHRIQRFMECCAEVQKCNMDNKFYNAQKDKYGEQLGKNVGTAKSAAGSRGEINEGAPDEGIIQ